jgi:FHS family L-fucose permease-like MFS transporter
MALATTSQSTIAASEKDASKGYLFPFILVTCLFFFWGFSYGLLDVLNKHFQDTMNVSKARSTLLQASYFGAYFLVALPAGLFMNRYGYKRGIIVGLSLFALGAFLFYLFAASDIANDSKFNFFLGAFLVLASGLTFLETAANPYSAVLGKPELSEFRLNLSQSFNGVGAFLGPLVGGILFFSEGGAAGTSQLGSVQIVYVIIGIVVSVFAIIFWRTHLPEIKESTIVSSIEQDIKPLAAHRHFIWAIVAQFLYVGAQVGIAALFINYCIEANHTITAITASKLLGTSLVLFTIGRFTGSALMKKFSPHKLLTLYAIINMMLCIVVVSLKGDFSVYALMAIFFFESIMFPTIFALGVKDLGHHTKKGSSFLVMSIAGGAIMPYLMGRLATPVTANGYIIPLFCFAVVAWYGWKGYKVK